MSGYYAVARGKILGVFLSWEECKTQVTGFSGAVHKKFKTLLEAQDFIRTKNPGAPTILHAQEQQPPGPGPGPGSSCAAGARAPLYTQAKPPIAAAREAPQQPGQQRGQQQQQGQQQQGNGLAAHEGKKRKGAQAPGTGLGPATKKPCQTRLPSDPDPEVDRGTLVAFCDGSAINNGQANCRSGWACVFPHNPEWDRAEALEGAGTNNRAEYSAALEAMRRANQQDPAQSQPLFIFSDSKLLIQSMTEWVANWVKRNWVKADGQKVQNRDLLEKLVLEQGGRRVVWKHVKAHTGRQDWESRWNNKVDVMAQEAARRGR